MTVYGVTATGFVIKPLSVIKAEIEADQRATLGANIDQQADSVLGVLNGIFSAKISEQWELAQAVYNSEYPDTAEGVSLDNVAALTGAQRLSATKSAVIVHCVGTPGTVLASGREMTVGVGGAKFHTLAGAVIGGGGTVDVAFEAETAGPIVANATTLNTILTPVSGWASGSNPLDAIVGTDVETDEDFRLRRIAEIATPGAAAHEAIRAKLLAVSGVTEAIVFDNDTDVTVDTIPPHSIECVVLGGTDADVRAAIFASKADGIRAFGSTHGTVIDSVGAAHEIDFTRPTDDVLHVEVTVLTDPAKFPATGAAMIKASLAAYGLSAFLIGADVVRNKLFDPTFRDFTTVAQAEIPGILDVTDLEIKFGGAFSTANLVVASREIATLDTSNITVTVTT